MDKSILKNTLAGIGTTVAAASFGYFAVQYFGMYSMVALGAGMFGLGAAAHRTQQSLPQKSLSATLFVAELEPKPTESQKQIKNQHHALLSQSRVTANRSAITSAAKFVRPRVNLTKDAITAKSYGQCRTRLALCHRAKFDRATKATSKNIDVRSDID